MAKDQKLKWFVSIKWKYLALFTILLVIVNFGLSWQSSFTLQDQFIHHQKIINYQHQQQLLGLVKNSSELLIKTGYILYQSPVFNNDGQQNKEIDLDADEFLDNFDLESIYLFGRNRHDRPVIEERLPLNYQELLNTVFESEQATSGIFCRQFCNLFVMVPLLRDDKSTSVLFLSQSVAELFEKFHRISGSDVAIANTLTKQIYAITNAQDRSEILEAALKTRQANDNIQQLTWGDQTFALHYINEIDNNDQTLFILLSDITGNLEAIGQSTKNSMLFGLLGLIISEFVLLVFLTRPVSRIINLTSHLPLLSTNQHDKFRGKFRTDHRRSWFRDELDVLEDTTLDLSSTLQLSKEDLIWQAEHDALTGLKNRHRFYQDFKQVLQSAIRFGHEGALIYFDLDKFKYVNDTSGHLTGDTLLRLIAGQIRKIIRDTDIFSRLGGDEFALILPETNERGALELAEKIHAALSEITLPVKDYIHRTSASIGVVMFPRHGNDVEELVSNGDIAMYNAKDDGAGSIHLFIDSDGTREHIHRRLIWKDTIEKALVEKRLILYFQPILDIKLNQISHHEVLLRLKQENGEIIPPGSFILEAEQSSLINAIDYYVLDRAIGYLSKTEDASCKIAINLSGKTMNDERLVPRITELLSSYGVAPERVIFEVTETAAVADILVASRIMRQINAVGCQFALDDFGIGFSSFYYLKQLPVEYIKIDGAFIHNILDNLEDQLFVKAITTVISGLGKKTVAEYVEDEESLQLVKEYGVDYAQGYHIGKPAPEPVKSG